VNSKVKKPRSPDLFPIDSGFLAAEHAALHSGVFRIAGVDEAGRGPLAGPVVAAAVHFPGNILRAKHPRILKGLTDSKALSAKKRAELLTELEGIRDVRIGIGICSVAEIDQLNILRATHLAMRKALESLPEIPELALIDGLPALGIPCPHRAMVKGDRRCFSIAAASIVAKETRDRLMRELDQLYPDYGFASHKGYGTKQHLAALQAHGSCPEHRMSFRPVREAAERSPPGG
jgi:ribonuclease HII